VLAGTNPNTQAQQFIGYWRVGYDNLNGWPSQPSSDAFAGSVDEFTVYQYQMNAAQAGLLSTVAPPH